MKSKKQLNDLLELMEAYMRRENSVEDAARYYQLFDNYARLYIR